MKERYKKTRGKFSLSPPKKVLVIEDNKDLRDLYARHLTYRGFEVRTATDGENALGILIHYVPNVIILDVYMPIMDGVTFLKVLKNTRGLKKIPVIMLTVSEEFLPLCFEMGANSYVFKYSNTTEELIKKISLLENNS